MIKVALVMVAVSDLAGSGGAERFFSRLHEFFGRGGDADVTLVTSTRALGFLHAAGRPASTPRTIALRLGAHPARGRRGVLWMTLRLLWVTLTRRFDLVHICLPTPSYVPYAAALRLLPRRLRPRVTITVIDCTLAHSLDQAPPPGTYERQVLDAHRMYERWTRLDGIYSWYRAFLERVPGQTAPGALVRAARYCFTDTRRFVPAEAKEQLVVCAGRLSDQKRPWLFVEAVARLRERSPDLIEGWRFEMYGGGMLEPQVRQLIDGHGIGDILSLSRTPDMAPVFARSRLFVSTQAFENFTSLAMLEAMAAGNAVIAEDIGQTTEFVRHGANGLLVSPATAETLADAVTEYLSQPERHATMATESRRLATEVHTVEHFADDITEFWRDVLHQ